GVSDASDAIRSVRRPRRSISAATSSMRLIRRPVTTTSAPASASPRASVRPIPLVPPTTTALLPVRSKRDINASSREGFGDRCFGQGRVPPIICEAHLLAEPRSGYRFQRHSMAPADDDRDDPTDPQGAVPRTAEARRLAESVARQTHWQRWGPYLSARAWGS